MSDVLTTLPPQAENISRGGFNLYAGPVHRLPAEGETYRFALVVIEKHMNGSGAVHGGLLMSLADISMSQASRAATGGAPCNTVSMTCDFVGPAKLGEILESRVRITRKTRTLVFLSAQIVVGPRIVATASGLWKIA